MFDLYVPQKMHDSQFVQDSKLRKVFRLNSAHLQKRLHWSLKYIRKRPDFQSKVNFMTSRGSDRINEQDHHHTLDRTFSMLAKSPLKNARFQNLSN